MPRSNVKLVGSWAKLNGYRILINYFTSTNGGGYVKDNDEPIEFAKNLRTPDVSVTKDISAALAWNGNTYEGPKLAENSASAEISSKSVTLNPSDPVTEVIINLYHDVKTKAEVVVHFVDSNGQSLREDIKSGEIYVGSDFDVTEAVDVTTITFNGNVYDFLNDSDAVYTGIVDNDVNVITRVYQERGKASVIVQFVDENGNKLREDITSGSVILGQSFNVSTAEDIISITIDGKIYDFDSDGNNAKYSGTMQSSGAVINRVYKERERASVIVQFVDDNGNKLRGDITSDKTYIGSDFDVSSAKSVTTITIDGVTYEFVSDNNASYSGKMASNGKIITRIYMQKTVSIPESTIPESSVPETTTPETTTPEGTTPETTTPETTTPESNKPASTVPNTGDFGLGLWISTLLLSACAILIISRHRRHVN